jgi:hypothetical protein
VAWSAFVSFLLAECGIRFGANDDDAGAAAPGELRRYGVFANGPIETALTL